MKWLRDNLNLFKKSIEVERFASNVPDSGGVYFVPALTGLGAPYWDPYSRGTILGISRRTTKEHIFRAALEGVAFEAADVLNAMASDAELPIQELRVDGGIVVSDLLMQFQADLLRTEVLRPQMKELTALGAAFLAGLAMGFWKDKEEIAASWQLDQKFTPVMEEEKEKEMYSRWKRAVECARMWEEK